MQVAIPGVTRWCTPYTDYVSARLVILSPALSDFRPESPQYLLLNFPALPLVVKPISFPTLVSYPKLCVLINVVHPVI